LDINGQDTKVNLNILPLGSYDILIGMDWLEKHKVVLNCYEKSFIYKDESGVSRTMQGINKPVFYQTNISNYNLISALVKAAKYMLFK
jgi:hypothetical protein